MSADLMEFVEQITGWHDRKVANLRDVLEGVKGGTTVKASGQSEDLTEFVLTDRDAVMFRLGMESALMELGKLPFTVSRDDADDADDD